MPSYRYFYWIGNHWEPCGFSWKDAYYKELQGFRVVRERLF